MPSSSSSDVEHLPEDRHARRVSGSSSPALDPRRGAARSSGSSATAFSRWRRARAEATANTSAARFRRAALLELARRPRARRDAPRSAPTARRCPRRAAPRSGRSAAAAPRRRARAPAAPRSPSSAASGWSSLLIAITSGISMIPAFSACTESPEPGISASTTVSAIESTPISLWPVPTVSRKTTSLPAASRSSSACSVDSARPPAWPRVPIERMKTPGSRKCSAEPDPVAEQRAVRERARRVDRDDADGLAGARTWRDERGDQARLADARRAREADRVRMAGVRVEPRGRARRRPGRRPRRARSRARARACRRRGRRRRASSVVQIVAGHDVGRRRDLTVLLRDAARPAARRRRPRTGSSTAAPAYIQRAPSSVGQRARERRRRAPSTA